MRNINYLVFAPQDFPRQFHVNAGEVYIQTVKMDTDSIKYCVYGF